MSTKPLRYLGASYAVINAAVFCWLVASQGVSPVWFAWPVGWGVIVGLAYLMSRTQEVSMGMFGSKLLTLLVGVPILASAPLYPPSIRLAFVIIVLVFGAFAALIMKDDIEIAYYAFRHRKKISS